MSSASTSEVKASPAIAAEDRLRADLYNFIGLLLAGPPDQMLLDQTAALQGDESELGQAVSALSKMAKLSKPKAVESEFNRLFIGLGRGELLPFASYYLTGFLNEKPLALLRQDMSARGLARSETVFEPEDSIASLMEMMGAMIVGRFGTPVWSARRSGAAKGVLRASYRPLGRAFLCRSRRREEFGFLRAGGHGGAAFHGDRGGSLSHERRIGREPRGNPQTSGGQPSEPWRRTRYERGKRGHTPRFPEAGGHRGACGSRGRGQWHHQCRGRRAGPVVEQDAGYGPYPRLSRIREILSTR